LNIPVWTAARILRLLSLNPVKLFAARNVKRKTWKKRCPSLLSRERIGSSEPAVPPVAEAVHPETVPVAIDRMANNR
jgi:hypothetical protein